MTTAIVASPDSVLRPTRVRYLVVAAVCVITAINYIQRNSIGAAETTIRDDLSLTREQTGDAMAWFFWSYALFQIPSGWLAQRWGPRWALTLFAVGWSLALGLAALSAGLAGLISARLLMGMLQAGVFPCVTLILAAWLPASRRAFASGLLNSCMLIGGAVSSQLTGVLLNYCGWREVFGLDVLPGVIWAVWFVFWFRNRPQDHRAVNPAELTIITAELTCSQPGTGKSPIQPSFRWWTLLLSAPMWLIGIQQFFRAGANRFFDMWLPTYLQEERGGSVLSAGLLTGLPSYAAIIGGMVGGWFSDSILQQTGSRRAGRQGVAIGSLLVATLCYLLAYPISDLWLAISVLSLGYFIGSFAAPCAYALTMDMGGKQLGVVFGAMNMAGNFGSWAFVWVVPRLVSWSGGWGLALAVFAGVHLLAAVCWMPLNPNGTIGDRAKVDRSKE